MKTSHWISSDLDFVPLHSSYRLWGPWFPNIIKNLLSFEKIRTLAHWARVHFFFSFAYCLWFSSGLTLRIRHLFPISWTCLCMMALGLLTPASKSLNWLCLIILSSLWSSFYLWTVTYHTFPFPPTFHEYDLIQHSARNQPFQQWSFYLHSYYCPHLCCCDLLTGLLSMKRVSVHIFWPTVKSAVFMVVCVRPDRFMV